MYLPYTHQCYPVSLRCVKVNACPQKTIVQSRLLYCFKSHSVATLTPGDVVGDVVGDLVGDVVGDVVGEVVNPRFKTCPEITHRRHAQLND